MVNLGASNATIMATGSSNNCISNTVAARTDLIRLREVIDRLTESSFGGAFNVMVNDNKYVSDNLEGQLQGDKKFTFDEIFPVATSDPSISSISSMSSLSVDDVPSFDNKLLGKSGESEFQKSSYLQTNFFDVPSNFAINKSSGGKFNVTYMPPQESKTRAVTESNLSGKPDGLCTVIPLTLELKSANSNAPTKLSSTDIAVITQAVDRVTSTAMAHGGLFKLVISIAATSRHAWLVVYRNKFER